MIGANTRAVGMSSPFTISNTFIPMLLRVRTAINIVMTCERQSASNLYYNIGLNICMTKWGDNQVLNKMNVQRSRKYFIN